MFHRRQGLFARNRIPVDPRLQILAVLVGLGLHVGERQGYWEIPDKPSPFARSEPREPPEPPACADVEPSFEGGTTATRCDRLQASGVSAHGEQVAAHGEPTAATPQPPPMAAAPQPHVRIMDRGGAKFVRP